MSKADRLQAIYDRVPAIACQRKCWPVCGAVPVTRTELAQIRRAAPGPVTTAPFLERERIVALFDMATGHCSALSPLRLCSVHAARPLICRLYGVTEDFRCAYGCVPERMLSKDEARALIEEARAL